MSAKMESTASKNRISQFWRDPEGEPVLTSGGMAYLSDSMVSAVQLKMDELSQREAQLERREAQVKEREAELNELLTRRDWVRTQIDAQLQAAMTYCAHFAVQFEAQIVGAELGWADGRFRFVFLTQSEEFDWELSDHLTEMEAEMLERVPGLPVSCLLLPHQGVPEDLAAILEVPMYTLAQGE